MPAPTLAEQASDLITESFKDGEAADGAPTEEEQAAHAANEAAKGGEAAPAGEEGQTGEETGAGEGEGDEKAGENKDEGGDETGKKEGEAAPKPAKAVKPAKDRIADLTGNWRAAQRDADAERTRAERAEAELAAIKSGKAPLTPPNDTANDGDVPPDPAQFEYGELDSKYIVALARHETKQALKADKAEQQTARQAAAADDQRRETAEKQDKLTRAGLELHDDFDEVVMQGAREGKWDLSPHLGPLLLDSDFGPQVAYDLAKDPAEATRVSKLSPADQAKWLGRQEAKFEAAKSSQDGAKPPPKTPQAPPPPKTPRGNSGQFQVGADSNDFAAVEKAWRSGALR